MSINLGVGRGMLGSVLGGRGLGIGTERRGLWRMKILRLSNSKNH